MAKTTTGKITDLRQDDRNANRHKERGKELLQKSIHELGAGRSVLADANNVLIAGNNTVETAISEGITKTLVVETTGDTLVVVKRTDLDLNDPGESGRRARQMALVDNAAALEGITWDVEAVQEIEEQWGFEAVEWGVEFPEEEKEIPAAEEDEGAGALPSHPVTVKGDVWELISEGKKLRHRVMCGDSTDSDAVVLLMNGQKADMVFTDPPYNVQFNGRIGKFDVIKNDDLSDSDFNDFIKSFVSVLDLLAPASYYVWCNWKFYGILQELLKYKACIVWAKNVFGLGNGYRHQHEFCLFNGQIDDEVKNESDLWEIAKDTNYVHPTQKPIALAARALGNHKTAKSIIDCFLGSGSTLIACEQLNRNCYGMELDEKYCDVIVRRWIAQMEKDGAKWKVLLNGEERADMVSKLLEQGN